MKCIVPGLFLLSLDVFVLHFFLPFSSCLACQPEGDAYGLINGSGNRDLAHLLWGSLL